MSLLIINGSTDLYGASRIMVNTLSKLQEVEELVLLVPATGPLLSELEDNKIKAQVLIYPHLPIIARFMYSVRGIIQLAINLVRTFFYLRSVKRRFNCKIAYINTQSCLFLIKLCKLLRIKTFLHLHEILDEPPQAAKFINRKSLQWADHIICVSGPVRENLLRYARGTERAKVTTILNGISDRYQTINSESGNGDILTVSLVGRIKPGKGCWFFLDAIALLPEEAAQKCKFLLIGDQPPGDEDYIDRLKEAIHANKYGGRIQHIPFTRNVGDIQARSAICVVPSLMRDPFPTTVLESMAAGKPVIATNTGGTVQSVVHGETGFLIEPGDTAAFSNYIHLLVTDEELRNKMGRKAREKFLKEFTLEIFQENFVNTYKAMKGDELI